MDHQALVLILVQSGSGCKGHKFDGWRAQLAEFDYKIQHKPGLDNIIPDMLSRLPQPPPTKVNSIPAENFSLKTFGTATSKDNVLCLMIKLVNRCGWKANHRQEGYLAPYYVVLNNLAVNQGLLLKADRIVVPSKLPRQLVNKAHEGHPGILRAKIKLPIPTDPLLLPKAPWEKIVINITRPFATAPYQNRFAIVIIDYLSGFPEVLLCPDHTAEKMIKFLTELFAGYGNPALLVSDNGPEY
uniref:Integrase catalytic domain-containing protein n=1 Tax=Romanomermis culicivorax TaxID=13658 RepID=A0A915L4M7_ROMCU